MWRSQTSERDPLDYRDTKQMNANDIPKDTYIEITNGVDERETENGLERIPTWVAIVKTVKGKCNYNHSHWELKTYKHTNITELMKLIEKETNNGTIPSN